MISDMQAPGAVQQSTAKANLLEDDTPGVHLTVTAVLLPGDVQGILGAW